MPFRQRLQEEMAFADCERLRVFHLDRHGRLLLDDQVAMGGRDYVECSFRDLIFRALVLGTVGMVLVHNHPSGCPAPSALDRDFTRRLCSIAGAVGIRLVDHLIVATGGVVSFREMKLL